MVPCPTPDDGLGLLLLSEDAVVGVLAGAVGTTVLVTVTSAPWLSVETFVCTDWDEEVVELEVDVVLAGVELVDELDEVVVDGSWLG